MTMADIAREYGVTRQAIYARLKADDKKKEAKNTTGYRPAEIRAIANQRVDPETGFVVSIRGNNAQLIGKMGDEKTTAFVAYHMEMLRMRQGVDKRNVPDLYRRFAEYLAYCAEHGIIPSNMNAYFAMGLARQDISAWHCGTSGTPEHKEFADMVMQFFASIHEQGAIDGVLNPISSIFWQKAHDGLVEASKLEVTQTDPLGDRKSAEDIARVYHDVELPE